VIVEGYQNSGFFYSTVTRTKDIKAIVSFIEVTRTMDIKAMVTFTQQSLELKLLNKRNHCFDILVSNEC
jgi:hypothetical protein